MNAQCYQILTEAYQRYVYAEGGTFTNDLMPQQTVSEMLAEAIEATIKMDGQARHQCHNFSNIGTNSGGFPTFLRFHYNHEDEIPPWKWSKIMLYQGKKYKFMSFNSDDMYVCYKEIADSDIAQGV